MNLIDDIVQATPKYRDIRRHIHAHPELGFEEVNTSDLVAETLADLGIEVHRGLGTTGVVGTIRYGDGGTNERRALGLRADMDALPMQEENDLPYKSKEDGKFHGCGHDGHTAMLLAAAEHLVKLDGLNGTVHLIFQPAEEGLGGGKAMVDEGLFELFPCDMIFGMHNWPGLDEGKFATRPGPCMASSDFWDMTLQGTGGHGAYPQLANNPFPHAARLVSELEALAERSRADKAVVVVTQIHGGDAYNVIPERAVISGGVRNFDRAVQARVQAEMQAIFDKICAETHCAGSFDYREIYPVLVNADEETKFAVETAATIVGAENVDANCKLVSGSEDFAFMLQARPGNYIFIGAGGPETPFCHNPHFDFNDALLPIGASYWVALTQRYLGG